MVLTAQQKSQKKKKDAATAKQNADRDAELQVLRQQIAGFKAAEDKEQRGSKRRSSDTAPAPESDSSGESGGSASESDDPDDEGHVHHHRSRGRSASVKYLKTATAVDREATATTAATAEITSQLSTIANGLATIMSEMPKMKQQQGDQMEAILDNLHRKQKRFANGILHLPTESRMDTTALFEAAAHAHASLEIIALL